MPQPVAVGTKLRKKDAPDFVLEVIELFTPTDAFVASLERRLHRPVVAAGAGDTLLERAIAQVEAYLAGERQAFDLPIRLDGRSSWDRAILAAVTETRWGRVTSYGRLARHIGRPGAARAAGGAVGRNPIGLLVPCHRVIAGDGSLGGYGGAWYGTREQLLAIKRELLELEGIRLPAPFAD